jgi:hypothetical protein
MWQELLHNKYIKFKTLSQVQENPGFSLLEWANAG